MSSSIAHFTTDFSVLTESLYLLSDDVSLLGGINIDFHNSNTPQDVTELLQLQNLVESPPRVTATSSYLLDVIRVSQLSLYSPADSLDSLGITDHHLVITCSQSFDCVRLSPVRLVPNLKRILP